VKPKKPRNKIMGISFNAGKGVFVIIAMIII